MKIRLTLLFTSALFSALRAAQPWVLPEVEAPRLQRQIFHSAAAQTNVSYFIYTPEAYDTQPERRFPVVYWLHGSGGGLPGVPRLAERFDKAIRSGKVPPMLVVFVNGLPGGMWCDSKDGKTPVESMVMKDLLPHVDANFRTITNREGRLVEGFSMGGYGAGRLGFKYPEIFGAVSMMGAGPMQLDFTETPRVGPRGREQILNAVYGGDLEYFKAQSPWRLAEQNAAAVRGRTPVRQVIGGIDSTLEFNRIFHEHLAELNVPHTFTVLPGVDHNPTQVMDALGEANWEFYRTVFGKEKTF
jgi:enterochelin esterase-like enzyme